MKIMLMHLKQDGKFLEIYRCCTDGTRNACSMLYGACLRIARNMGYKDNA